MQRKQILKSLQETCPSSVSNLLEKPYVPKMLVNVCSVCHQVIMAHVITLIHEWNASV